MTMLSNKDIFLQEYTITTEMMMRHEYEAWQHWQALLTWADDRIRQAEQFFLDLRADNLVPVEIASEDQHFDEEWHWFMRGDSLETPGRSIPFAGDSTRKNAA